MPEEAAGQQKEDPKKDRAEDETAEHMSDTNDSFPWLIFCVALFFDLIGMIPIINIFSEILAGFIFGIWQKFYFRKSNPLINFFVAKIIDALCLGFLPSNIAIVIFTWLKKKSAIKLARLSPKMQKALAAHAGV